MSEPNIILACYVAAFVLGALSMRYNTISKWCFWLFIPAAWLFAIWAPEFTNLTEPNDDGFLTFYMQIYEDFSAEARQAVFIAPVVFLVGRLIYFFYDFYFVTEYVESNADRKKRVRAMFDPADFQ